MADCGICHKKIVLGEGHTSYTDPVTEELEFVCLKCELRAPLHGYGELLKKRRKDKREMVH